MQRTLTRAALGLFAGLVLAATPAVPQPAPEAGDPSPIVDPATAAAEAASTARIGELERQLAALRAEVAAMRAERAAATAPPAAPPAAPGADGERLGEIERRLEVLAGEIERLTLGEAAAEADRPERGLGPAASKVYRTAQGLSIGGYGEMLYERFDDRRDDGTPSGASDQLDLLRGIVYVGYKFDDRFLLNTEIEVEHAATGEEGEVSLEFAYVDYLHRPALNGRAGLLLVPMGFVNELHEPTVFYGARRPDLERVILPTTWRENGFGLFGELGPFTYRTYLINGLEAAGFSAGGLRGGRQKGSKAIAESLAWVGRLDYTATPGLLVGASAYLGDSGQDLRDPAGQIGVGTRIVEAHAEWKGYGFAARLLAARAEIDDVARLNRALGLAGTRGVGERLEGFYAELGYDLFARHPRGSQALVPYARYERFDTHAGVPAGFAHDPARDVESWTLGLAYRPIDRLIVKADLLDVDNGAGSGVDQINLALGYVF